MTDQIFKQIVLLKTKNLGIKWIPEIKSDDNSRIKNFGTV